MEKLKEILIKLRNWMGVLLFLIIVIRIISLLIPSLNPDTYINKAKDGVKEEKVSNSWFDFPDPGSWGTYSGKPIEPTYLEPTYLEAKFDNPKIEYTPGPSADYRMYQNQNQQMQR